MHFIYINTFIKYKTHIYKFTNINEISNGYPYIKCDYRIANKIIFQAQNPAFCINKYLYLWVFIVLTLFCMSLRRFIATVKCRTR